MKCPNCNHYLSQDEINTEQCLICGTRVEEVTLENEEVKPQEAMEQFSGTEKERNIIYRVEVYVTVLSILIIVGGFIIGLSNENFAIVLIGFLSASVFYCLFKVLLLIANLLCDIRDNTSDKTK